MGFAIVVAGIQQVADAVRAANLEMKAFVATAKEATSAVKDVGAAVHESGISDTGASGDLGTGTGATGSGNVAAGLTNALKAARR